MTAVSHLRLGFSAIVKHVISPDSIIVENVGELGVTRMCVDGTAEQICPTLVVSLRKVSTDLRPFSLHISDG